MTQETMEELIRWPHAVHAFVRSLSGPNNSHRLCSPFPRDDFSQGAARASQSGQKFGHLLGAQLAKIKDGQPANLQGQLLNAFQDGEYIWPQEGDLKSLQNGQIVHLQNGSVVSLQTKESQDQAVWCFVEVKEGDLCRIQKRIEMEDLFSSRNSQFIKLEHGRIAQIQNGEVIAPETGQLVPGPAKKLFQVGKGQLFEVKNGLPMEVDPPLPFVQDDQLAKLQGGE